MCDRRTVRVVLEPHLVCELVEDRVARHHKRFVQCHVAERRRGPVVECPAADVDRARATVGGVGIVAILDRGCGRGNLPGGSWLIVFEKAIAKDPGLIGTFSPSGDSMIYVNKEGHRVANEKLAYNEMAQTFFQWDGARGEYPNLLLIAVWDQRSQDNSASDEYGRFIVPRGTDDAHVIKGATLAALSEAIGKRLARYESVTGGLKLAPEFEKTLGATIERFNGFAAGGKDFDFGRGERQVELLFNGSVASSPSAPNPTMFPISEQGPYYGALLTGGTLDTKGGPKTNVSGQLVDDQDQPIKGLYGVGNCVASASARAYWAGGATIGPILALAYLAAAAANKERKKAAK